MSDEKRTQVTTLITAIEGGDRQAAEDLLPLLYDELRNLARSWMTHEKPQTLQPTALVYEAYLRLVGPEDPGWEGRRHFFGAAARAMRRILIERARRYQQKKRGADYRFVELDDRVAAPPTPAELLAVDECLRRLEVDDPRMVQVVEIHRDAKTVVEGRRVRVELSHGDPRGAVGAELKAVGRSRAETLRVVVIGRADEDVVPDFAVRGVGGYVTVNSDRMPEPVAPARRVPRITEDGGRTDENGLLNPVGAVTPEDIGGTRSYPPAPSSYGAPTTIKSS